tara:strand:+ start:89 stop:664 length:576 start_codon:yes stop_codon:yes gene_type:complete
MERIKAAFFGRVFQFYPPHRGNLIFHEDYDRSGNDTLYGEVDKAIVTTKVIDVGLPLSPRGSDMDCILLFDWGIEIQKQTGIELLMPPTIGELFQILRPLPMGKYKWMILAKEVRALGTPFVSYNYEIPHDETIREIRGLWARGDRNYNVSGGLKSRLGDLDTDVRSFLQRRKRTNRSRSRKRRNATSRID